MAGLRGLTKVSLYYKAQKPKVRKQRDKRC